MSIAEKLTTVAENQQRVYDAGFTAGQAEGGGGYTQEEMDKAVADAIEDGKQAEYDRFWDAFQQNGERRYYSQAFAWQQAAGAGWASEAYNPKHPIICEGSNSGGQLFYYSSQIEDVKVPITFRNTHTQLAFGLCYNLKTIPSVTFENVTSFDRTFRECRALETLIVHGSIDVVGLDLQASTKLNKASIEGVIAALSTTTTGLSVTLSKVAVDNAFKTSAGAGDGSTSTEWTTLANTRSNWTINLV